jgi:hypothetical protein
MTSYESVATVVTLSACDCCYLADQVKWAWVDSRSWMKYKLSLLLLLFSLTLMGCGGGGGGASSSNPSSTQYVDSWPIYSALASASTSYTNKNDLRLLRTQIDSVRSLPGVTSLDANELETSPVSLTFGDFFQDGQLSAFVVVKRSGGLAGKVYFLRWKDNSKWVDDTQRILSNRNACVNSEYAITSDFNNDGKPDVFLSCGGSVEEEQLVFLSSSNSATYTRVATGIVVKGNRASAGKLDGDGFPDLVLSNKDGITHATSLMVFKGTGSSITPFEDKTPSWFTNCVQDINSYSPPTIPVRIEQVFLIPTLNSRLDLVVSGELSTGAKSQIWLRNQASAPFFTNCTSGTSNLFPSVVFGNAGTSNAILMDLFYISGGAGTFYAYMQTPDAASAGFKKFPVTSDLTLNISNGGSFTVPSSMPAGGFPAMFRLNQSNQLIPYDAGCSGSATGSRCGLTFLAN